MIGKKIVVQLLLTTSVVSINFPGRQNTNFITAMAEKKTSSKEKATAEKIEKKKKAAPKKITTAKKTTTTKKTKARKKAIKI